MMGTSQSLHGCDFRCCPTPNCIGVFTSEEEERNHECKQLDIFPEFLKGLDRLKVQVSVINLASENAFSYIQCAACMIHAVS